MIRQNANLTFKGNLKAGRHGWLRLTPAYSVELVRRTLGGVEPGTKVLDPFSGTGTTGLCAAERGLSATLVDVNPFLVWFAGAKTKNYSEADLTDARALHNEVARRAVARVKKDEDLWEPGIFNIERWWSSRDLQALKGIRAALDDCGTASAGLDLLLVSFCRTLISVSNAAFNHQSMSFKVRHETPALWDAAETRVFDRFAAETAHVIESSREPLHGAVRIISGDSRSLEGVGDREHDLLYTSPPYANRMSYVRELRPYMYWLRSLERAKDFGELDWQAIGGTWGAATSRLMSWNPTRDVPLGPSFEKTLSRVEGFRSKNGPLLARYLHKYFHDMWLHFREARRVLSADGRAVYIVGNSSFFGELVPTHEWYATLMRHAGFENVQTRVVRKRNSKRELFEYAVEGAAG